MVAFALNAVRDHHPLLRSRIIPTTTNPSTNALDTFDTSIRFSSFVIVGCLLISPLTVVFGEFGHSARYLNRLEPNDFGAEVILDTTN